MAKVNSPQLAQIPTGIQMTTLHHLVLVPNGTGSVRSPSMSLL